MEGLRGRPGEKEPGAEGWAPRVQWSPPLAAKQLPRIEPYPAAPGDATMGSWPPAPAGVIMGTPTGLPALFLRLPSPPGSSMSPPPSSRGTSGPFPAPIPSLPPALLALAAVSLLAVGCGGEAPGEDGAPGSSEALASGDPGQPPSAPAQAFLANLALHCGSAYSGGLTLEPPGDDMLTGTEELIVHFRECDGDTLRLPFHIELEETASWDRSRTWVLTPASGDRLELRHDHREPDGTPSERTMYGGFTETPGTPERQDFVSVERTEESGFPRGWRIEVVPGERYTYGTTRRGEWSWRIDFDLSRPVPVPPAPWGHEAGG